MNAVGSGYTMEQPSPEQAQKHLIALFGREEGMRLWGEACQSAGFASKAVVSMDDLSQVVAILTAHTDLVGLVGLGMQLRIRTYQRLCQEPTIPRA